MIGYKDENYTRLRNTSFDLKYLHAKHMYVSLFCKSHRHIFSMHLELNGINACYDIIEIAKATKWDFAIKVSL